MAGGAQVVLQQLAEADPRELHLRQADGRRALSHLHDAAVAAGLAPGGGASTELQQLRALFDAAVQHGLGAFVLDYAQCVALDPGLTSRDPLEAHLLDAGLLQAWCAAKVTSVMDELKHLLLQPSGVGGARQQQQQQQLSTWLAGTRLCTLLHVATTLLSVIQAVTFPQREEGVAATRCVGRHKKLRRVG